MGEGMVQAKAVDLDVGMRTFEDLSTEKRRLVDSIYFDGLNILRCYEGRFRFSFRNCHEVLLESGETMVIYPRHTVTIDALEKTNRLVYGVFEGADVERYFDSFGFFDFAKGRTEAHYESLMALKRAVEVGDYHACLSDILRTQADEIRKSGKILLYDAVRHIHLGLKCGKAQVKFVCEALGISRMHLNRIFGDAGLGTPSEFIRRKQLHIVRDLLENTQLQLFDVAEKAGFLSSAHFATFVRRMTGKTPTQIRNGQ